MKSRGKGDVAAACGPVPEVGETCICRLGWVVVVTCICTLV